MVEGYTMHPDIESRPLALTKFFTPDDFADAALAKAVADLKHHQEHLERIGLPAAIPVEGRYWEYGLATMVAAAVKVKTVLDVGCGKSLFLPTFTQHNPGAECFTVEPKQDELAYQLAMCNHMATGTTDLRHLPPDKHFDLVTCLSVIEHVDAALEFAAKLRSLVAPGGALFLTADAAQLQPDIYQMNWMRKRIYTPPEWQALGEWLISTVPAGQKWDYLGRAEFTWRGTHVYDYSFASMALRRLA